MQLNAAAAHRGGRKACRAEFAKLHANMEKMMNKEIVKLIYKFLAEFEDVFAHNLDDQPRQGCVFQAVPAVGRGRDHPAGPGGDLA